MFNKKNLRIVILSTLISAVMVFAPIKAHAENIQRNIITQKDGEIILNVKAPYLSSEVKKNPIKVDTEVNHEQVVKLVDMDVKLSAVPNKFPTAMSVNIIRKINGVVDDTFQWFGGTSSWYEDEKILKIYNIKYVEGAEYEVTFTDQQDINILEVNTQIKEINLQDIKINELNVDKVVDMNIKLSAVPNKYPTAMSINIIRKINGVVDETFKWNGGTSSWRENDKVLNIYNVKYVEGAEYEVTFLGQEDIQIEECNIDNQNKVILYGYFNSEVPIDLDMSWFNIKRYVNGELDNSFNTDGVFVNNYYNKFEIQNLFSLEPGDYDKAIKYAVSFNNSGDLFSNEIMIKGKNIEHNNSIDIEFLYPGQGFEGFVLGGDAKVKIRATNNTNEDKKCTLIIALYDKYNRFINYIGVTQMIRANGSTELLGNLKVIENGYKIKAFIWDDFESMNPLSKVIEIPIIK